MPGRWQTITRTLQHDELERLRWMSRHHPNTGRGSSGADARTGSAGQLILTLNGTDLAFTVVGRATGTSEITGDALINTSTINSVPTVRNPTGESTALTITPLVGGTRSNSASLVIEQLG